MRRASRGRIHCANQPLPHGGNAGGRGLFQSSQADGREFGGTVLRDANGFLTYDLTSVGPQCEPTEDCEITIAAGGGGDVALWHTHLVKLLGDRTLESPFPDYVTMPIGATFGTFLIGPWQGGIVGEYLPQPEMLNSPQIAPICQLSVPSFSGVTPCP